MESIEIKRLRYRRQYIISPKEIQCPFIYKQFYLNANLILYSHMDLRVTEYSKDNVKIFLLGDIFDYQHVEYGNSEILKELIDSDFLTLIKKSAKYSGRYVIIFLKNSEVKLFHDATATRKIFYTNMNGSCWFASQPYLLSKILNFHETKDPSKIKFYNSPDFNRLHNSNIGNTTRYDEILQLLPNHYFDLGTARSIRYWPDKKIEYLPISTVAEECSQIIKGFVENIADRYSIMIPVTAGKDSRSLLGASRDIKEKIFYYVNKDSGLKESSNDIAVPKKMLFNLGLDFHIIDPFIPIDEYFKKIYFENNPYASPEFLPHIFNYYRNFADKVNLPGNIASAAFEIFKFKKAKVSALDLAILYKVQNYDYAVQYYENWLTNCIELCTHNNISIIHLFYWEERLPNWGSQIQMEKDIAQEDFNPFNSRQLIELYLSVKHRFILPPNYILHKKIIQNLWPELLNTPINPSIKNNYKQVLNSLGILEIYYKIRNHLKH